MGVGGEREGLRGKRVLERVLGRGTQWWRERAVAVGLEEERVERWAEAEAEAGAGAVEAM